MARDLLLRPIGRVESPVTDPSLASRQGDEGAPDCWLVFDADVQEALDGTPIVDIKPVLGPRGER